MSKWVSVKDELPDLFTYCLVTDSKGFINYAVYIDDVEYGEDSRGNYFAEVEAVRLGEGEYMCEDIGAEILNVTHFLELPTGFDDGLSWLREEISKTIVQKSYKQDWFDNCKPDENY